MGWLVIVALVVVIVGVAVSRKKPAQLTAGPGWQPAIDAAAQSLGGRPALSGGEAQLRAEHGGVTVTVKMRDDVAFAECPLHPGAGAARIYLASGAAEPPTDIAHFPEVTLPPAYALDPPVVLRSDDPAAALAFAEGAPPVLLELLRVRPRAIEALIRGGTTRLTLRGVRPQASTIEELVRVTARLAALLGGDEAASARATKAIPAATPARETCALCSGERRPEVAWVKCRRCGSLHHAECFDTAKHCAKADCGGVLADAV